MFEAPARLMPVFGPLLAEECKRAGLPEPRAVALATERSVFRLSARSAGSPVADAGLEPSRPESYALGVAPDAVFCAAPADAGLYYGLQTLRQLIRANRRDGGLPCLRIRDWPSLRWRCFQDDWTRGPSPKPAVLTHQVDTGSYLKLNLFTYYMECQFAFRKHPQIGPKDGSIEPEELAALVAYAKPRFLDVLGNQQSFGHFGNILKHDEFAALRETPDVLSPVKEETYQLLDDMYSEVCPLVPFEMFNVCCDETWGLGTGPSKPLADQIGVGGVYVQHIRRVHDLLRDKHKKRMMMWGDIILQHPDKLDQIPEDTVMLTWGYGPAESFEGQIVPFAKSGYEFFVCPGVSNWSRILPDFAVAGTNIRNFVRDGAKHGAIGMLNTDWEDDGESLSAPTWHGDAWGAECAWNASTTSLDDFNRRIGAVLFGEKGDHFGQAIELLAQTHTLAGFDGMNNRRFWHNDFQPERKPETVRLAAGRLLDLVRPAIEHLEACRREAKLNQRVLDHFLFGARRMERIGRRMLDGVAAVEVYQRAYELPPQDALPLLARIEQLVRENRDAHESLGREFSELWLEEAKPYALDWTMKRYTATVAWYDALLARLADARKQVEAGQGLPAPDVIGLALPESFARRTRPHEIHPQPFEPDAPWAEPQAAHRIGVTVAAGPVDRCDLPVEVDVAVPADLVGKPVRAFRLVAGGEPQEIPAQLDPSEAAGKGRLVFILPGLLAKGETASVVAYLGLSAPPAPLAQSCSTREAEGGMFSIENDQVRMLLGPEGAHVYRWEVKRLSNRDLTMPGESGWAGWSDVHGLRSVPFAVRCTARGPAAVRYECREPSGMVKTVTLFAGASWMEVVLNDPVNYYWDFDNPKNFAADGPTPGEYLFSGGQTGRVGKEADGVPAQVRSGGANWGVKFNAERLAVGMVTPEVVSPLVIAPGAGAGGVGIEGGGGASHFVTFAGLLADEPAVTMNRLRQTLDYKAQPRVGVYAVQAR